MKNATLLVLSLFITGMTAIQAQDLEPNSQDPIIASWDMEIDAPGGRGSGVLSFFEEEGQLMVKTENGSQKVKVDGNNYNWKMAKDTPMGTMDFKVNATLDGDSLNGTMEMLSGMAAGRVVDFTASRK